MPQGLCTPTYFFLPTLQNHYGLFETVSTISSLSLYHIYLSACQTFQNHFKSYILSVAPAPSVLLQRLFGYHVQPMASTVPGVSRMLKYYLSIE